MFRFASVVNFDRSQLIHSVESAKFRKRSQRMSLSFTVIFFCEFHWHDLGFLAKILISLGFLGKINCQDHGKKSKKSKILGTNERNPRSWQQMKKIQDLGKKFKSIQVYPRYWQENQDAKHWGERQPILREKKTN